MTQASTCLLPSLPKAGLQLEVQFKPEFQPAALTTHWQASNRDRDRDTAAKSDGGTLATSLAT